MKALISCTGIHNLLNKAAPQNETHKLRLHCKMNNKNGLKVEADSQLESASQDKNNSQYDAASLTEALRLPQKMMQSHMMLLIPLLHGIIWTFFSSSFLICKDKLFDKRKNNMMTICGHYYNIVHIYFALFEFV